MVVRPTNWHTWGSLCPLLRPVQLGAYSGRQKSTFLIKKLLLFANIIWKFIFFQTGVISFYLTGYPLKYILDKYYFEQNSTSPDDLSSWPLWVGFGIILTLSAIFEIVENAQCTIDKYRMGKTNFGECYAKLKENSIIEGIRFQIQHCFIKQPVGHLRTMPVTHIRTS